ncbi:ribonuclease BN/unknown domain fusion protein [Piscirickettsia salmonis]|uniref:YihY family inner membrane protein n=2 Tax=Piscirickettsia salmonis TaxID=1238 RepID=UPI0012BB02C2|nr:YihY family inner membrane protein [Piscirickettsia salmonis]QGP54009.1 ribonuclease BN/unknown domain fusion protein [Piscirickettsia salmonis]QGP60092.1 ribonuclease BN/unknown domain fusion protein [Piscirickettsia salmonis]QGP63585.1 ribonuclease BN/unknown domain fusion protein [Piscirickettsia salmonis]
MYKFIHMLSQQLKPLWAFILWICHAFKHSGCIYRAAALTFTSLLTLGPLVIVLFAILMSIPAFQEATLKLQAFILNNFVPSASSILQGYISSFQQQSTQIPVKSIFFLLFMAILLFMNVESALNDIWGIKKRRPLMHSLLLYWALLTLGPIVLGISLTAASSLLTLKLFHDPSLITDGAQLIWLTLPFLSSVATLTFLYMAIPYCRVRFIHALSGAVFAAICIEAAKLAFAWYVADHMAVYKMIYGTLAILPIFLVWVYWSWLIFLLGAQIVNGLRFHQQRRQHATQALSLFNLCLQCLYHLFHQQQTHSAGLTLKQLQKQLPHTPLHNLTEAILLLDKHRYIAQLNDDSYIITHPLSQLSLLTLYQLFQTHLKHNETTGIKSIDDKLAALLEQSKTVLDQPLQQLFESATKKDKKSP